MMTDNEMTNSEIIERLRSARDEMNAAMRLAAERGIAVHPRVSGDFTLKPQDAADAMRVSFIASKTQWIAS